MGIKNNFHLFLIWVLKLLLGCVKLFLKFKGVKIMKMTIIGTSKYGYIAPKEEFDTHSGHAAGICYMPHSFAEIQGEPMERTEGRIGRTKNGGHHSVYDHPYINLYLEDIPKALAMVLNNENFYATSEKSARYTKMVLEEEEQKLYDKWCGIYEGLIRDRYQEKCPTFFNESKIKKLAQENARYLISVFTPTSMEYSTTYSQINKIAGMMEKEIYNPNKSKFYELLTPAMIDFVAAVHALPYRDEHLGKINKQRVLSLVRPTEAKVQEVFGDVYATTYKGSFAQFAQAQRHRTLNYDIQLLDEPEFYVPPILNTEELRQEWKADCEKQAKVFPQGMLIQINEYGKWDKFLLKMYERRCTCAQLEIANQTKATYDKYLSALKQSGHPLAEEFEPYQKGARCTFPDFTCGSPCGFVDGIKETREI